MSETPHAPRAPKPGYLSRDKRPLPRRPNFIPQTPNYYTYSWVDKDPDMEFILGVIGDAGLSPEQIEQETEKLGHKVSRWTVYNWMYTGVRKPQNFTMTIVALACGWEKEWHRSSKRRTLKQ